MNVDIHGAVEWIGGRMNHPWLWIYGSAVEWIDGCMDESSIIVDIQFMQWNELMDVWMNHPWLFIYGSAVEWIGRWMDESSMIVDLRFYRRCSRMNWWMWMNHMNVDIDGALEWIGAWMNHPWMSIYTVQWDELVDEMDHHQRLKHRVETGIICVILFMYISYHIHLL